MFRSRMSVTTGLFQKVTLDNEEVQLLDYNNACEADDKYSYDECIYGTIENITLRELGCTVPWLPQSLEENGPK